MAAEARPPPTYRVFRDQHGIPQFEPKRGTQALKDALIYAFPALETELQLMQAALRKFFDSERGTQFVCELPENNLQSSLAKKRETPVSPLQATKTSLRNWKLAGSQRTPSRPSSRASSRASSRGRSRASSQAPSRGENSRVDTPTSSLEPLVEIHTGGMMTTWTLSNGQELEKRKRQPYDPIKRRKVAENRGNACDKHRASKTTCDPDQCPHNKLHSKAADESLNESRSLRGRTSQVSLSLEKQTKNASISDTERQSTRELDAAFYASLPSETPPLIGTEIFWDAFEQNPLEDQAQRSISNFGDSGYWTDNDGAGPVPWNSCNDYPPLPGPLDRNIFSSGLGNFEAFSEQDIDGHFSISADAGLSNFRTAEVSRIAPPAHQDSPTLSDETSHRTYTSLVLGNHGGQKSLPTAAGDSEDAVLCSEDPFMGWASKKVNHLFDDYGWVLSHVEHL